MKKIIFSVLSLILMNFSGAQASNASMQDALQNYNQALADFIKHVHNIRLDVWRTYCGTTTTTHYNYSFTSCAAEHSFDQYDSTSNVLNGKILGAALGDGFILGTMAAGCVKVLGVEPSDTKLLLAGLASAIGVIMYKNCISDPTPYYDLYSLKRYDNMFSQVSVYTCGRVMCALAGATAGYFGTHYALDTMKDTYDEICPFIELAPFVN